MAWIVMLVDGERRRPVPLVNEDEQVLVFKSRGVAEQRGAENPLGKAYGYRTLQWPYRPDGHGAGYDDDKDTDDAR